MKYMPEIGIRAHDLPASTPLELKEYARKLDIKYVQLALSKSFSNIQWTNHKFSIGLSEKIREQLGDLRISVLGSYINLLAEGENLEQEKAVFKQNMLFAKYLNAGVIGTETGMSNHTEEDYKKVLSNLSELVADAEKLGVIIGIEGVFVHTINTPKMMKRLMNDIKSPNVMTIFDPVNYISIENYKDQDMIIKEAFELLSDKMAVIHIKDFDIKNGEMIGARVGKGIFNIRLLFDCIREYKPYIDVLIEGSNEQLFEEERKEILKIIE